MKLWIAEKPSVAKAVSAELGLIGNNSAGKGYYECNGGNVITWCFGHLLEQAEPDFYTADDIPVTKNGKKVWRMEDLPIFPKTWKLLPKKDKGVKVQLKVIKTLLAKADSVVNCGDPDREGQLLVDEILEFYGNRKPVERFWVSAQDPASIRKGLSTLQLNAKFKGMKLAAEGRSRADWLLGMNLTRALTLAYSTKQERRLIAVGRVQTPTLALVADRDKTIKNFIAIPYYVFTAHLNVSSPFKANWKPSENQAGLDSEGRLINAAEAKKLQQKLSGAGFATITKFTASKKSQSQPKAYSLADIQLEASNKYGFSAQETLDTCQSLYEKHKAASYPRSDCQYLPESQLTDAPKVLTAITKTFPLLSELVKKADTRIKSPTWNDKKITAHHGIIPTQQAADIDSFSDKEKKIYELIAHRYIAQFYPEFLYNSSSAELNINNERFTASGRNVIAFGWKALYAKDAETDAENTETDQSLPKLTAGQQLGISKITLKEDKTKPPAYFTEGTLIAAMEKIHTVVENPEHKKLLKEGDGIGTPATRAAIISELKRKGYLEVKGKKIHASSEGISLLTLVPSLVKNPVLTAVFERKLSDVESGKAELNSFLDTQKKFILQELAKAKKIYDQRRKQ